MIDFDKILSGGDLRSIGKSNAVILQIHNQNDFDQLFNCLFHKDRLIVMRAADAIEKFTIQNTNYLKKHKAEILKLSNNKLDKELQWHLALLIPRLPLNKKELLLAWDRLTNWAKNKKNSRIIRVNAIQGLFAMKEQEKSFEKEFYFILSEIEKENIPSTNARIKKIRSTGL